MATLYKVPMVMKNEAYLVTNRYVLFSFSGRCFCGHHYGFILIPPPMVLLYHAFLSMSTRILTVLGKIINNIV